MPVSALAHVPIEQAPDLLLPGLSSFLRSVAAKRLRKLCILQGPIRSGSHAATPRPGRLRRSDIAGRAALQAPSPLAWSTGRTTTQRQGSTRSPALPHTHWFTSRSSHERKQPCVRAAGYRTRCLPPAMTQAGLRRRNVGPCRMAGRTGDREPLRQGRAAGGSPSSCLSVRVPTLPPRWSVTGVRTPSRPRRPRRIADVLGPPGLALSRATHGATQRGPRNGATQRGVEEVRGAGGGLGC